METFVPRKGILRPAGAEDKRESGANPGQFPLLYALQCRRRIVEPLSRGGREGRLRVGASQKTCLCTKILHLRVTGWNHECRLLCLLDFPIQSIFPDPVLP